MASSALTSLLETGFFSFDLWSHVIFRKSKEIPCSSHFLPPSTSSTPGVDISSDGNRKDMIPCAEYFLGHKTHLGTWEEE